MISKKSIAKLFLARHVCSWQGRKPEDTHSRSSKSEIKALARAENFDDVLVVQGNVLSTYIEDKLVEKIAFAHFDLNDFETEMKILEKAVQNTSNGSVFLFDDFAMLPFREQNKKYRTFFREKGLEILELPTGQGLVIF